MKKPCFTALMVLWAWIAPADVTVTNMTVAQRPGTKLVDITYDVSSTESDAVTVLLKVSNGTTAVSTTALTGDAGPGVLNGTGKSIVWNMAADWDGNAAALSFSIWAYDGSAVCVAAKTGQTTSYRTGDDGGESETGAAWPDPRFTDHGDGTVTDNLTGLEWVKAPHALAGNSGATDWNGAIDFCNGLVYAGRSDWRLPSIKELESLVNCGLYSPALPAGHPFSGVQSGYYWSGTSFADNADSAWYVLMGNGYVDCDYEAYRNYYAWPVRGGQQEPLTKQEDVK